MIYVYNFIVLTPKPKTRKALGWELAKIRSSRFVTKSYVEFFKLHHIQVSQERDIQQVNFNFLTFGYYEKGNANTTEGTTYPHTHVGIRSTWCQECHLIGWSAITHMIQVPH